MAPRIELGFPDDDVEAVDELAVAPLHRLVLDDALAEHALQADDAEADFDAGAELVGPERLGQVVVGAGREALEHRLGAALGGEDDDVDDAFAERLASQPAQLEAVDPRHVDVDDHDPDREVLEQRLPGEVPVGRGDDLVAPLLERSLQDAQRQRVVIRRQDLHRRHNMSPPETIGGFGEFLSAGRRYPPPRAGLRAEGRRRTASTAQLAGWTVCPVRAASSTASRAAVLPGCRPGVTTGGSIAAGRAAEILELRDIEGRRLDDVLEDLVAPDHQDGLALAGLERVGDPDRAGRADHLDLGPEGRREAGVDAGPATLPGKRRTAATLMSTWVGPMTALAWTASGSAPRMVRA